MIKQIIENIKKTVIMITDVAKKAVTVFVVLSYLAIFVWSIIATLIGWYFKGWQTSLIGFIVFCLCAGILLHIGEQKRGDNIGGESNEKNDTELREDT